MWTLASTHSSTFVASLPCHCPSAPYERTNERTSRKRQPPSTSSAAYISSTPTPETPRATMAHHGLPPNEIGAHHPINTPIFGSASGIEGASDINLDEVRERGVGGV